MTRRDDIDGLRAIAILSVLIFHAWPKLFPAGFTGVDIFFVISGFLITKKINADLDKDRFSFVHFYLNRAKRLFLPCAIVLIVTVTLGFFILHPKEFYSLKDQVFSTVLFYSNFYFRTQSGYFASASELKPFLHSWSLSLEEQFYFFHPLMLAILYKLRWNRVALLTAISVFSFLICLYGTFYYHTFTFFMLPTRVWELLVGAIVACVDLKTLQQKVGRAQNLAWLGLIWIFLGFVFIKEESFPGAYALLPVIGTGLIIAFSEAGSTVAKLLSNKVFKWIGLISYSLYLWHWPLLSFAFIVYGEPPHWLRFAILGISFVLAFLTYKLIEAPFGKIHVHSDHKKFMKVATFSCLCSVSVLLFTFKINNVVASQNKVSRFSANDSWDERPWWISESNSPFGCHKSRYASIEELKGCLKTDSQKRNLFLIGDSHAGNWSPLFMKYAQQKNYAFSSITAGGGCSIYPDQLLTGKLKKQRNCHIYNNFLKNDLIGQLKPKDIVVISLFSRNFTSDNLEVMSKLIKDYVAMIKARGAKLVLFHDVPYFDLNPGQCSKRKYVKITSSKCNLENSSAKEFRKFQYLAFTTNDQDVLVVDPFGVACEGDICRQFNQQGDLLYSDRGHLTRDGSLSFLPKVQPQLDQL